MKREIKKKKKKKKKKEEKKREVREAKGEIG